jgi:RsiW-degrading membrane proteinase PrsW (M82 family)
MTSSTPVSLQQILNSPWALVPLRFLRSALPGLNGAMPPNFPVEAALGLAPVLLYLAGLLYIDSFKLVRISTILGVLLLGAGAALASYFFSGVVIDALHLSFPTYSKFYAPFVEEGLKSLVIVWMFSRGRIGFMVDAAILGLAAGAGFSVLENVYYAYVIPDANVGVWIIRGFGTALMHGGVTAIFAVSAQTLRERHAHTGIWGFIPGYFAAVAIHSIFNQFIDYPAYSAAVTILALPLALLFLFDKSEHKVHDWLVHDYESHEHLLEDIRNGTFAHSEAGRFINDLAARFNKAVVTAIFTYIKLHTELVLRAEKLLLAKENGTPVEPGPDTAEKFARLHTLERQIGRTALLTIWPHLKFSRQELWELHRLESGTGH